MFEDDETWGKLGREQCIGRKLGQRSFFTTGLRAEAVNPKNSQHQLRLNTEFVSTASNVKHLKGSDFNLTYTIQSRTE